MLLYCRSTQRRSCCPRRLDAVRRRVTCRDGPPASCDQARQRVRRGLDGRRGDGPGRRSGEQAGEGPAQHGRREAGRTAGGELRRAPRQGPPGTSRSARSTRVSPAIVLVDARKGVLPQSRRHAFIASLLAIPHVVVAVNKMDLVDYSEEVFTNICADFQEFARDLHLSNVYFIPISALEGDNVVSVSPRTPWYRGGTLLHILETVPIQLQFGEEMRFPVQYVVRPTLDFRGYAGQVASGVIKRGDRVMVLPSGRTSRVKSIVTFDGDLEEASCAAIGNGLSR